MKIAQIYNLHHQLVCLVFCYVVCFFMSGCSGLPENKLAKSKSGISVKVNKATGAYQIDIANPDFSFKGSVQNALSSVSRTTGTDSIGTYNALHFAWSSDNKYQASIRRYNDKPVVLFSLKTPDKAKHITQDFPSFKTFPDSLHHYSFADDSFAPHKFKLLNTSTPWLLFNDENQAAILSPASDFMVSKMTGDGVDKISSGLNPGLQNIPAGFTHKTIMVFSNSTGGGWRQWGDAMRSIYGRKVPSSKSDPMLKYYGYWTDNGAYYYYNYDKGLGYQGTLLKLKKHYQSKGLPMGYLQLDSWWYKKSDRGYEYKYKPDERKNNSFTSKGNWDTKGGMVSYQADKELFPEGLEKFQDQLQIPLIVHNRWVDPLSAYHKKYEMSGIAGIGIGFWNDIAQYIQSAGVVDYEQDWLSKIYANTPKMASNLSTGNAFTDNMAKAMKNRGLNMQYCMAMPRHFMQGVKYNNLTTIRTSHDGFTPSRWRNFIYSSQLAYAMGIWPWSDVFRSRETGNMILSVLSAGVVGTGDKIGEEDKANIMKAARPDGILVKPDAPLLPLDKSYINDAKRESKPMLAYTFTKQNNIRTNYVLAFAPAKSADNHFSFTPSGANLAMHGPIVVYNPLTDTVQKMHADSTFTANLSNGSSIGPLRHPNNTLGAKYNYTYYVLAPVTPIGAAFLGDRNKIAATGRQRISTLKSSADELKIKVNFAEGESSVQLQGYYKKPMVVSKGDLKLNADNHRFTLTLESPENKTSTITILITLK